MRDIDVRVARVLRKLEGMRQELAPSITANTRDFRVNPPASESEITRFELNHDIEFPLDYREFIARVGNGADAGPYYGLLPLDAPSSAVLHAPFPIAPGHRYADREQWWVDLGWSAPDAPQNGLLPIGDLGLGHLASLVVSGPARGRVVYTWNGKLPPTFPAHHDFLSWYEGWLDDLACEMNTMWYGMCMPGTLTELVEIATEDDNIKRRMAAVFTLSARGVDGPDDAALPALRSLIGDAQKGVRAAVASALGRRGEGENASTVRQMLADPVRRIQRIAEWSLGVDAPATPRWARFRGV